MHKQNSARLPIAIILASAALLSACTSNASTESAAAAAVRSEAAATKRSAQPTTPNAAQKPLPFALLGVHFDNRTRAAITAHLKKAGLQPAKPRNRWCDRFHQGRAAARLPGVGTIQVCYTSAGAWAEMDMIYPGGPSFSGTPEGQAPGLQKMAQDVTAKYGQPATEQGDAEVGQVEMVWRVPGGGEVIVLRGFPVRTLTLAMLDMPRKQEMAQEAQAAAQTEQARRAKTPNPLN